MGVARVPSTTTTAPASCPASERRPMSTNLSVGFVGVSRYSTSQPLATSSEMASGSVVSQSHLHARPGEELQEDFVRPAVSVLHGDDAVPGCEECEKGVAYGRHAGCETRRGLRRLKRPNLFLEGAGRGVSVAAVDAPRAPRARRIHSSISS